MSTLRRDQWDGHPVELGDALRKGDKVARCILVSHELGGAAAGDNRPATLPSLQVLRRSSGDARTVEGGDACEGLGVSGSSPHDPIRLWMCSHSNGWETWVAELGDGTFASWACPAAQSASSLAVEDSLEHASAAASYEVARLSGHTDCDPSCGSWGERDPIQHECHSAENR